jgi:hypothetical protein
MNNTFCLALFLALVYFRELSWTFSAETTSILVIEAVMAFVAFRSTIQLKWVFLVGAHFPFALGLVSFLEGSIGWD